MRFTSEMKTWNKFILWRPSLRRPSVVVHHVQSFPSPMPLGHSMPSPWEGGGAKVHANGSGRMAKKAAMSTYSKTL